MRLIQAQQPRDNIVPTVDNTVDLSDLFDPRHVKIQNLVNRFDPSIYVNAHVKVPGVLHIIDSYLPQIQLPNYDGEKINASVLGGDTSQVIQAIDSCIPASVLFPELLLNKTPYWLASDINQLNGLYKHNSMMSDLNARRKIQASWSEKLGIKQYTNDVIQMVNGHRIVIPGLQNGGAVIRMNSLRNLQEISYSTILLSHVLKSSVNYFPHLCSNGDVFFMQAVFGTNKPVLHIFPVVHRADSLTIVTNRERILEIILAVKNLLPEQVDNVDHHQAENFIRTFYCNSLAAKDLAGLTLAGALKEIMACENHVTLNDIVTEVTGAALQDFVNVKIRAAGQDDSINWEK